MCYSIHWFCKRTTNTLNRLHERTGYGIRSFFLRCEASIDRNYFVNVKWNLICFQWIINKENILLYGLSAFYLRFQDCFRSFIPLLETWESIDYYPSVCVLVRPPPTRPPPPHTHTKKKWTWNEIIWDLFWDKIRYFYTNSIPLFHFDFRFAKTIHRVHMYYCNIKVNKDFLWKQRTH